MWLHRCIEYMIQIVLILSFNSLMKVGGEEDEEVGTEKKGDIRRKEMRRRKC